MRETTRKILNTISLLLILIGFVGFLLGFVISMRIVDYDNELPLSDAEGIIVSNDGRIYLGLQFYGVVQTYDSNGIFLKNWEVQNSGGTFRLAINNDIILVATARGDRLIKYDLDGNRLSQMNSYNFYSDFQNETYFFDSITNATYKIKDGLFPVVTKNRNGHTKTIITIPLMLKLFKGPMPVWLIAVLGMAIIFFINKENFLKRMERYK